jgi:SAM-dependent methyltransferase
MTADPRRFAFDRLTYSAREQHIRDAIRTVPADASILDVGAGQMPYRSLLDTGGRRYVAVDIVGPAPVRGRAEELPFAGESFDVVVCFQVLEHVDSPEQAVREFARVLRPGGRVLLSTHGVFPYHPNPKDLWRWTAEGLDVLFRREGFSATIAGLGGTGVTLAMLAAYYVNLARKRYPRMSPARWAVPLLLRLGRAFDRRLPELSDPWRSGTLFGNYFVDAVKVADSSAP